MVFEPKYTRVVSSTRKNIGISQSVVDVKLPTNDNNVGKVYSINASSVVSSVNASGKDIVVGGLIDFQVVYESVDGVIGAIDYTAEYKDKYMADVELVGDIIATCCVVDVKSNVNSGEIRATVIVEVVFDEIINEEKNILTSVAGDGVHTKTDELVYSNYIGKSEDKFDVNGEIVISKATNVLSVTTNVGIINIVPKENYAIISGRVGVDICYQTKDGVDGIKSTYNTIEFENEISFDGINENSCIQSMLGIAFNEIKVSTAIENDNAVIGLYVPINYSGYIFNMQVLDIVGDIYFENNYLSTTTETFSSMLCCGHLNFKDNISGVASIPETAPFIDEVLGVCTNNIVLASAVVKDGVLTVEGVANATVMYYTKDSGEATSLQVEMPFMVENNADCENSSIVSLTINNVSARSKRGKEIEVSAELNVYADTYSNGNLFAVTSIVVGDEKPEDECSLYIYIVKPNQTLWDIAKDMNVSEDMLMEQNDIELPLKTGDKIIVYKPQIASF